MNNNYFIFDGVKYIILYNNKQLNIYKYINNEVILLSDSELKKIKDFLDLKYGYIYDSVLLNDLINSNNGIENKQYISNFLTWLENTIPKEALENFYNNVKTLKTSLKLNIDLSKPIERIDGYTTSAGYNTRNNSLIINESSLLTLWEIAKNTNDPEKFYLLHYAQTILHELSHMASSKYDPKTKISLCGFDKYPAEEENDKNRGLTEGFTEIISMAGVPGTVEISSAYYIEACLVNQLIQIIGLDIVSKSYFTNKGTIYMQDELNNLIYDPSKSFDLFRNIELNYIIKDINNEQNILGNIQDSLLDYLDKKLEKLISNGAFNEVSQVLYIYEQMMVTTDKLKIMKKLPEKYIGIEENVSKFNKLKEKYAKYLIDNKQQSSSIKR